MVEINKKEAKNLLICYQVQKSDNKETSKYMCFFGAYQMNYNVFLTMKNNLSNNFFFYRVVGYVNVFEYFKHLTKSNSNSK